MKVVFFGSPKSALPSLRKIIDAGHTIELIITQPDKPSGRGKNLSSSPIKQQALAEDLPIYQSTRIRKDPAVIQKLREIKPDLNVVVAYGQIIPDSIIYLPRYNSINLHFSLLPKFRGASPVQWAILEGENTTGLTVFELNAKMDEGNILAQRKVEISPDETAYELESRLSIMGAELLVNTISKIQDIEPQEQDHTKASFAPLIKKTDGQIDWTKEARFIERQIRAFTPWPSTFTFLQGRRIKVISGKSDPFKSTAEPGEIVNMDKKGIGVMCGDGSVFLIERLQPENKKEMKAYAFSLGANIKPGDTFF